MRIKLAIVILIIVGLIYYAHHHKKPTLATTSKQVLGTQSQNTKSGIKDLVVESAQQVLDKASNFVDNQVSQATGKVSDYVFSVASQNVIKQIDKLPDNQKQEIRQELCK